MLPRRSIDQIITYFTREKVTKHIYVEGDQDKKLIRKFLSSNKRRDIAIYPISTIDIPDCLVESQGLPIPSARARVITLACKLEDLAPPGSIFYCIVDKDFGPYVNCSIKCSRLLFTDYNSMEMYLYRESTVREFLEIAVRGFSVDASKFISLITPALKALFLIRLANEMLDWRMKLVSIKKYLSIKSSIIDFKEGEYINACLLRNGKGGQASLFRATIKEAKAKLIPEIRCNIRGHDYTDLVYRVVSKLKRRKNFADLQTAEAAMYQCLDLTELRNEKLFQTILAM